MTWSARFASGLKLTHGRKNVRAVALIVRSWSHASERSGTGTDKVINNSKSFASLSACFAPGLKHTHGRKSARVTALLRRTWVTYNVLVLGLILPFELTGKDFIFHTISLSSGVYFTTPTVC